MEDGSLSETQQGKPACYMKEVKDGQIVTTLLPLKGKTSDILRECNGDIIHDTDSVEMARKKNPYVE